MKHPFEPGANVLCFISWLKQCSWLQAQLRGELTRRRHSYQRSICNFCTTMKLCVPYPVHPICCTSHIPAWTGQFHVFLGDKFLCIPFQMLSTWKWSQATFVDVKRAVGTLLTKLQKITVSPSVLFPMVGIKRKEIQFPEGLKPARRSFVSCFPSLLLSRWSPALAQPRQL